MRTTAAKGLRTRYEYSSASARARTARSVKVGITLPGTLNYPRQRHPGAEFASSINADYTRIISLVYVVCDTEASVVTVDKAPERVSDTAGLAKHRIRIRIQIWIRIRVQIRIRIRSRAHSAQRLSSPCSGAGGFTQSNTNKLMMGSRTKHSAGFSFGTVIGLGFGCKVGQGFGIRLRFGFGFGFRFRF